MPSSADTTTAGRLITSDTRLPWMIRLRMSRPRWSVPSQATFPERGSAKPGGLSRSRICWAVGERGPMWSAKSASPATVVMIPRPITARRWRKKRRRRRRCPARASMVTG